MNTNEILQDVFETMCVKAAEGRGLTLDEIIQASEQFKQSHTKGPLQLLMNSEQAYEVWCRICDRIVKNRSKN